MVLNSLPFPGLGISNSCLKDNDTKTQTQSPSSSHFCFFTHPVPWLVLLVSSICVYAICSGLHLLSLLLTCSALILATFAFTFLRASSSASDRKAADSLLKPNSVEEEQQQEEEEPIEAQPQKETQVQREADACDSLLSSSPDGPSDTESIDHTSACSEVTVTEEEWPFGGDLDPAQDCSDGSISDEESLIEIALPNGYYIDPKKYWSDCYSMEPFQQQNLMELLAEINEMAEEENMIEIDISMGSIKCPRFEIKA